MDRATFIAQPLIIGMTELFVIVVAPCIWWYQFAGSFPMETRIVQHDPITKGFYWSVMIAQSRLFWSDDMH